MPLISRSAPDGIVLYLFLHYVVVHEVAVANVIIALTGNTQAEMLIESLGLIIAVDMQKEAAGTGVLFLYLGDSSIEELTTQVKALITGENINLLEFVEVGIYGLHRHVTGCIAIDKKELVDVMFLRHLPVQTYLRVHHVHHIVALLSCDNVFVCRWKNLLSHTADDRNVVNGRYSYILHHYYCFCRRGFNIPSDGKLTLLLTYIKPASTDFTLKQMTEGPGNTLFPRPFAVVSS